jgi:hypothetical protein
MPSITAGTIALNLQCAETYNAAFIVHPQHFRGIAPKPSALLTAAWINPPKKEIALSTINPVCSN